MMIKPKVSPMPTWLTPPSVIVLMMTAPVPAKTSPKVPTNSAANRCNAVLSLRRADRLASPKIPIEHLRVKHGAVFGRRKGFGDHQEPIRFGQRTQYAGTLPAGDACHVPVRRGLDCHPHEMAPTAPVLDTA